MIYIVLVLGIKIFLICLYENDWGKNVNAAEKKCICNMQSIKHKHNVFAKCVYLSISNEVNKSQAVTDTDRYDHVCFICFPITV